MVCWEKRKKCVFCFIKEFPTTKVVLENEKFIVFHDIAPKATVHLQVVCSIIKL